jgi:hypothetical protein
LKSTPPSLHTPARRLPRARTRTHRHDARTHLHATRARLAKLLRFHSSKSRDALTSLDAYVSRLQPGQKAIYWIAGMSQAEVSRSPFAEKLVAEVRCVCGGGGGGRVVLCARAAS